MIREKEPNGEGPVPFKRAEADGSTEFKTTPVTFRCVFAGPNGNVTWHCVDGTLLLNDLVTDIK